MPPFFAHKPPLKLTPWLPLIALTSTAAFLRFYNLTFDSPWWFHPDERTIPAAITQLSWPNQMLSQLFTYGSFPVYLNFLLLSFLRFLGWTGDKFSQSLIIGRAQSALLSTLLIPILWKLAKDSWNTTAAWTAALLTTFCVGFIQFAHFGTYEIWLTFQRLLLLILAIKISQNPKRLWPWLLLTGLVWGLSLATKITSLVLAPGLFLALLLHRSRFFHPRSVSGTTPQELLPITSKTQPATAHRLLHVFKNLAFSTFYFLLLTSLALSVWALTNPHILTDWSKFLSMFDYEGRLARGQIITFYTRQFINTTPLLFQATKVFPWILSWPTFLAGTFGILTMFLTGIKNLIFPALPANKIPPRRTLILIFIPLWALFQLATIGTLYVKWTRYLIPTLPYFILATAWLTSHLSPKPARLLLAAVIPVHVLWGFAFFSIYTRKDPRLAATHWASQNLDSRTSVLSESYDMGITAFSPHLQNITLFNFYQLDDPGWQPQRKRQLQAQLPNTQVIIVNSRRVWKNVLDHPNRFPQAANFYRQLFDGSLGFTKIADFSNFPRLGPLIFNDELLAEETFSVFDHPHLMIFQRSTPSSGSLKILPEGQSSSVNPVTLSPTSFPAGSLTTSKHASTEKPPPPNLTYR